MNLPERGKGRWGAGLTAEDMEHCRWLKPRLVASIEFLEWTPENRLRHPKFVALRDDRVSGVRIRPLRQGVCAVRDFRVSSRNVDWSPDPVTSST